MKANRVSDAHIRLHLDSMAACLIDVINTLDRAWEHLDSAFDGYDPGYPYPDSLDARAWDYVDAMQTARREILDRLETWDGYER
jgi:hypothetical protein